VICVFSHILFQYGYIRMTAVPYQIAMLLVTTPLPYFHCSIFPRKLLLQILKSYIVIPLIARKHILKFQNFNWQQWQEYIISMLQCSMNIVNDRWCMWPLINILFEKWIHIATRVPICTYSVGYTIVLLVFNCAVRVLLLLAIQL